MADNRNVASTDNNAAPARPRARDLNEQIRYTMWSVFRVSDRSALRAAADGAEDLAAELEEFIDQAAGKDVVTRGCYDVQGLRADADYMFWWTAPSADDLQEVYARFRRTGLGRASEPVWSVMALHRPAEFNKGHVPAFLAGEEPRAYACVYPFVRSYEWYLLDPAERREMLAEHGMMAREYPDVRPGAAAHPRGDPVLHRAPQAARRADRRARLTALLARGATPRAPLACGQCWPGGATPRNPPMACGPVPPSPGRGPCRPGGDPPEPRWLSGPPGPMAPGRQASSTHPVGTNAMSILTPGKQPL